MLVEGLPPESATWRHDGLPFAEEVAAQTLERLDAWGRLELLHRSGKRVRLPPPVHVVRPGDESSERQRRRVETDPRKIAAWFAQHMKP